jgi:hypothetical protein
MRVEMLVYQNLLKLVMKCNLFGRRYLSYKIATRKGAGGMIQVVEHLPSMYKAVSSNPSTAKKKKKIATIAPMPRMVEQV